MRSTSGWLKAGFGISLGAYLLMKLIGVAVDLPPLADLAALPAGVCVLGLAVSARRAKAREEVASEQADEAIGPGLLAGAVLIVFTITYLALNTVPMASSGDEQAILAGAHEMATNGSQRVTSPLNDRYHTNVIGALHARYRSSNDLYYLTFPGTAVLYAPFSVLPYDVGFRLLAATFGTLAIIALYFVAWKLLRSWWGALVAALVFAVSPAFGHWAVTVFNNVPVLTLELSALAVVLWAPRERAWLFGLAGALVSLAFFARITELVYVLPVFVLIFWRTRTWRPPAAFGAAALAGVALVGATNQIFYGDPLFLPFVGYNYTPFLVKPVASPVLIGNYAQFLTGATGSVSNFSWVDKVHHEWFHVRYLASSTFAFPFLPLAFAGLVWRLVARKRDIWVLAGAILTAVVVVLVMYGQRYDYYGVGQPNVRSSFVRYSLPIYALLAVAAGGFFLDARRVLRSGFGASVLLPVAIIAIVVTVGVAHSYDAEAYGYNRLNQYRQEDRAAWGEIRPLLEAEHMPPLLIAGPSSEKLLDNKYQHYVIIYRSNNITIPVAQEAAQERHVYFIASTSNQEDMRFLTLLATTYRPQEVLHAGGYRVYLLQMDPVKYTLSSVDVWRTYAAFDRWEVTPDGRLRSIRDTPYFQLTNALDKDQDGRVDQDVTLRIQMIDKSDRSSFTISALDTRYDWRPVALLSGTFGNTNNVLTYDVLLRKGAFYGKQFIVTPGITFAALAIVPQGG